jgi:inhibitor of cysteine peptidase
MYRNALGRATAGIAVVALVGIGIAGCGSDSKSSSSSDSSSTSSTTTKTEVKVYDSAGGDITATTGETFEVVLDSNPSTGFVWTVAQAPDPAVVTLEDQAYEKPDSSAMGAPGTERFTFKAVGSGTTTMALKYARPSDPDSPDNSTVTYTVTVS